MTKGIQNQRSDQLFLMIFKIKRLLIQNAVTIVDRAMINNSYPKSGETKVLNPNEETTIILKVKTQSAQKNVAGLRAIDINPCFAVGERLGYLCCLRFNR